MEKCFKLAGLFFFMALSNVSLSYASCDASLEPSTGLKPLIKLKGLLERTSEETDEVISGQTLSVELQIEGVEFNNLNLHQKLKFRYAHVEPLQLEFHPFTLKVKQGSETVICRGAANISEQSDDQRGGIRFTVQLNSLTGERSGGICEYLSMEMYLGSSKGDLEAYEVGDEVLGLLDLRRKEESTFSTYYGKLRIYE